jgi:hypothetical protein
LSILKIWDKKMKDRFQVLGARYKVEGARYKVQGAGGKEESVQRAGQGKGLSRKGVSEWRTRI